MHAHRALIAAAAALCAGCSVLPMDLRGMSPEQLREVTRDRTVTLTCGGAQAPGLRLRAAYVQLDAGVLQQGAVTVTGDCEISADVRRGEAPK